MTTANDPSKLPEGFQLDPHPAPAAAVTPAGLPAGYKLDAKPGSSMVPVNIDHFKSGVSNSLATVPVGIAGHQMDASPLGIGNAVLHAGAAAAHSIKEALGFHTSAPAPGSPAPDDYKSVTDKVLGVKGLPVPTDSLGHKSKVNEYQAKISEFLGANLVPGGSAVKEAEHKMATFFVSNLGTAMAGMGAVEGKEWGRDAAHHFGLDEKRGEEVGEFLGSLMGPGVVGAGGQAIVKAQQAGKSAAKAANLNGFSKKAQDAAAHSMLMKDLQQGAEQHPMAAGNLDRAAELGKKIPGFRPTAAQASGAPGLVSMQKEVANKSGETLGKAAAVDHANTSSIQKFKEKVFPGEKRTVVQPGEEGLTKSEGLDAARASNTFDYSKEKGDSAHGFGRHVGMPQPKGTPTDKLFSNFADHGMKNAPEKQAAFRKAMLARANGDPKPYLNAKVTTHEADFGDGHTVKVEASEHGQTRVQVLDHEGKVIAAARLKKGMLDSIAADESVKGQGVGSKLLKYIHDQKIGNIHEVPDRSPWFVKAQKRVLDEAAENQGPKLTRPYVKDPITDPARAQLSATKSVRDLEIQKNEADLKKLSDQHKRTVDNQAIGDKLREKYWQAREAVKNRMNGKLGEVYSIARRQGAKVDMSDIRDHVKQVGGADKSTFQDMPALHQKILNQYPEATAAKTERQATTPVGAKKPIFKTTVTPATPGKSEASFEELHSLYKEANKGWADASAAGDSVKMHHMQEIRQRLKAKLDQFEGPEHGGLAQKFKQFNSDYKNYAETFKNGAGAEIAKRGKYGLSRDAEDIVSRTILKAGDKKKGVQDFLAMHGDDAEAHQLLHDGIMDNFSKATMKSGTFNPKAAKAWLASHKQAMDELPSLRAKLESSQSLGESLVNRKAVLLKQRAKLDQTYLAKVAKTTNPDALIQRALGDSKEGPHIMRALLVGAKSPESQQSIARAIVDSVTGKGHGLDYILQHESTLKPVLDKLGPKHWENLKTIAEAEEVAGRVKAPTQVELSQPKDLGQQTIGTSVKSLFASAKAAAAGRMSKEYALLDIGGRFLYKQRADTLGKLREEAVFNPEMAELLSTMLKQKKAAGGSATHEQLLDLKRLAFNAGINATVEAVGRKREQQEGRNTQD